MRIIRNEYIPFKGFKAINLFGVLFVRGKYTIMPSKDINHEQIHTKQMKEMLYVFFYIWYVVEWFIWLIVYRDFHRAYRTISFEEEAYNNQENMEYLKTRNNYSWVKYIKLNLHG